MELISNIIKLFIQPDDFFKKKMEQNIDLINPLLIYFLDLILFISILGIFFKLNLPEEIVEPRVAGVILSNLFYQSLVAFTFIWIFNAAAIYLISIPFKGKGSFKRVFEFAGYAMVVYIPLILFFTIVLFGFFSGMDVNNLNQSYVRLESIFQSKTYFIIFAFINLVLANMHRAILRYACGLSNVNAALGAGIYFVAILLMLWQ